MKLHCIHCGLCQNVMALPISLCVEEDETVTSYALHFLCFYLAFDFTEEET